MVLEEQILDSSNALTGFFLGGVFVALLALGILIALLILAAIYIYFALAYKTIAEKLKFKKSWIAWIPIANWAMLLQLGGFHWAWIFLLLIPVLGWIAVFVLLIIAHWRIFEKLKSPGWFSLSMIIPKVGIILYAVAVGIVAWSKKKK
ncbi:MAG: hypothetical protein KKD18_04740 [Nanoarchaeota archaeon]|nr:hypothetical protein [Nanoarchaeota archaeon]MBU0977698.1 hypothetical protein [Nanoarchaeota archaeon]